MAVLAAAPNNPTRAACYPHTAAFLFSSALNIDLAHQRRALLRVGAAHLRAFEVRPSSQIG